VIPTCDILPHVLDISPEKFPVTYMYFTHTLILLAPQVL
jgi:hypothetical protein